MLKSYLVSGMAVMITAGTLAATQAPAPTAQQPSPPATSAQQPPAGQQPATAQKPATITLSGCLVREQDVPGRKPNVAERVGVGEDYILTSAAPAEQAGGAAQAPGAAGTSGSIASRNISTMYKVEGIPDDRLKQLVGKKVEVTGRVDEDDARETPVGTTGATPKTPADDMPEFEATAIREVPGSCAPAR